MTEPVPEGALCGVEEPCRPRGRCLSGVCKQPPAEMCGMGDIQVTLTWDHLGKDLELHLIRPGGFLNDTAGGSDCTWNTCITTSPDWGLLNDLADNPKKDIDNIGSFGPENIFLARPQAGEFAVMVEHWSDTGAPSSAEVTIRIAGQVALKSTLSNFASRHLWDVARISWPQGTVRAVGTKIDCSPFWKMTTQGCDLKLP